MLSKSKCKCTLLLGKRVCTCQEVEITRKLAQKLEQSEPMQKLKVALAPSPPSSSAVMAGQIPFSLSAFFSSPHGRKILQVQPQGVGSGTLDFPFSHLRQSRDHLLVNAAATKRRKRTNARNTEKTDRFPLQMTLMHTTQATISDSCVTWLIYVWKNM